jgi:hypothetical protein
MHIPIIARGPALYLLLSAHLLQMFTRPPKTKTVRMRRPVRPFDPVPGISTKAGEDSDEAEDFDHETEDPGHEAENLNDDQASKDHDKFQEVLWPPPILLEDAKGGFPYRDPRTLLPPTVSIPCS